MEIVYLLLKQNIVMFIYMLIGFLMFKKKLVTVTGSSELGKMLLYVVMPVAIIKSYCIEFSMKSLIGLGVSFAAVVASLFVAILISRISFGKKHVIEHFGASFCNAGFMGIPLIQMVIGDEAVFYVSAYVALLNILQWTYGVAIMNGSTENITIKKIITNPVVISFGLGILLFLLPVKLPAIFIGVTGTIASMSGPLAMIVLGIYLAQISLKDLFNNSVAYQCSAIRLIVIPMVTMLVLSLIPEEYMTIKITVLIAASTPVGSNVTIFAQLNNMDYKQAVKDVCLSAILCIITMPVILGIANWIW